MKEETFAAVAIGMGNADAWECPVPRAVIHLMLALRNSRAATALRAPALRPVDAAGSRSDRERVGSVKLRCFQ